MADFIKVLHLKPDPKQPYGLLNLIPSPKSLDEATRLLPGGGYTTFRTYNRFRILRLADHYKRLEETAKLASKAVSIDRSHVSSVLHQVLDDYPAKDMRVRIILDLDKIVGEIYILVEPLHTPADSLYRDGARVLTRKMHRENPKAKLTGFIRAASEVRQVMPPEINEVIMIGEDDCLLEGLSSNFFGIKAGEIFTADEGVLSGITRELVLEEVNQQNLPIRFEGININLLSSLDEAFITSASRAVLPVVQIDDFQVGSGKPGPITKRLQAGYLARVEKELDTV